MVFCLSTAAAAAFFTAFNNRIVVDSHEKYAGRLQCGKKDGMIRFEREFVLSNYGFTDIDLHSFSATCGCTNVTLPKTLKRFSSVRLSAHMEYPFVAPGAKEVEIAVKSSAKNTPLLLKLSADAENYYSHVPSYADFGRLHGTESREVLMEFAITTPPGQIPGIEAPETPGNLEVSARIKNSSAIEYMDGSTGSLTNMELKIRLSDPLEAGAHRQTLNLIVRGQDDYRLTVPVGWTTLEPAAFASDAYNFSPANLLLPIVLAYDSNAKEIDAQKVSISGKNFKIKGQNGFSNGREFAIEYEGPQNAESEEILTVAFSDNTEVRAILRYSNK